MLKEMKRIDECDVKKFGAIDRSEQTIAILGDRWWPQKAEQEGDNVRKYTFMYCLVYGKKRNERPNVGGVSIRSRYGAPSRKGCVVNGQMTKASNK